MIKEKIENSRGVSLISLAITVMVLVILSNIVIYNIRGNLRVEKIKEMQSDISNLRDKVSSYYAEKRSNTNKNAIWKHQ